MTGSIRLILFSLCMLVVSSLGNPTTASAQTTAGKDFWLGFMYNDSGIHNPIELTVYMSSPEKTSGTVSIPAIGWKQDFAVEPGKGAVVRIPSDIGMARLSEAIEPKAVHVESQDTIACFALNYSAQTSDASVILPSKALGREYRVMAYSANVFPSECMIVPTMDSTSIEITPSVATLGGKKAQIPFTVKLSRGEEYQIQSDSDLTGTRIISSKPLAVFGGSACADIPVGYDFFNHLFEEMYPLTAWGSHYITIPLLSRKGDTYRFLASEDSTLIEIAGKKEHLNSGQFFERVLKEPTVITASKPICVAQFSNSSSFDKQEDADPFMIVLSPNEQMQHLVTFNAFESRVITAYYLNLLVPSSGASGLRLDGKSVQAAAVEGDKNYSYAQLKISAGDHTLSCDAGFIAYVYGYGRAESYGYSAGASIRAIQHFALINGKALDKKSGKPVAARIVYQTLPDGREAGTVNTNPTTGEYTVVLPTGKNYGIRAEAAGYYAISDNLSALDTLNDLHVTRNLELAPIEVGQVIRLNNVFFDLNLTILRPESYPELDRVVKLLKENKAISIAISGHTDNIGSDEDNMKLSVGRASAVSDYITRAGIDAKRVSATGYGKTKPVATNDTEEGRQQNRRVEFAIVK
jgi:outer membrane protein OmpA-like peptidoglycan-associated protein